MRSLALEFLDRLILFHFNEVEEQTGVGMDPLWFDPETDMIDPTQLPGHVRDEYDEQRERFLPLVDGLLGCVRGRLT